MLTGLLIAIRLILQLIDVDKLSEFASLVAILALVESESLVEIDVLSFALSLVDTD